jgi:sec-independent protein translocase protein TatA
VFDFSPIQIIIVLVIALLIFGPKRLPEMGRNLGRGLRDFKSGISGEEADQRADLPPRSTETTVAAHQEVPAPTPEIAAVEAAESEQTGSPT